MLYIYFFVTICFIILGLVLSKKLVNPLTIFNFIWFLIVLLYQLQLSRLQKPLAEETICVLLASVVSFSLFYLFTLYFKLQKKESKKESKNLTISFPIIKFLFLFWLIIEVIETIYSGGLPIFWKIIGDSKDYMDYGIPTLHGFANSLGLVIIMLAFYKLLEEKKSLNKWNKKLLAIVVFMFLFYLCLITRQVIISATIQCIIIYIFFYNKIPWIKLGILAILGIIGFGILGNIRTGYEEFLNVSLIDSKIPSFLIGFYWVYMYLTMTVANINNTVILGITGYGCYPIFKAFIPTVISNLFFANNSVVIPQYIVTKAFNVSGFFIEFYLAYGILGVIIISGIYGILSGVSFRAVTKKLCEKNILYYAIIVQIISLSFFYNHLLYLPSGFQLLWIFVLFWFAERKNVVENEKS